MDASGEIIVVGTATSATITDMALVRYKPDGTLDTSLTTDFHGAGDFGQALALDPQGRIVAAGSPATSSRSCAPTSDPMTRQRSDPAAAARALLYLQQEHLASSNSLRRNARRARMPPPEPLAESVASTATDLVGWQAVEPREQAPPAALLARGRLIASAATGTDRAR